MDEAFKPIWPSGVPTSLWNYGLLQPEHRRDLPFMQTRPDWAFWLAFIVGAVVIAAFAWRRFRQRTFDPSSFDYRVLREFDATQLRGSGPMRRAYAYYAGALIVAYVALTLFGGLIFNVAKVMPMAGLQVDVSDDVLNSAQWPLIIAFGLAGFTPLIKPMELLETWLRQRAHKWVGIPVKIKDRTRVLLRNLERVVSSEANEAQQELPAWVVVHIEETDSVSRVMIARKQLELLLKLSRDEDRWPSVGVREEMRRLESEEIAEAEMALQNFDEILEAMAHAPGIQSEANDTKARKHQRRLEDNLRKAIERIDRIRDELCSIFTIYADKDLNYANINNNEIRSVVQNTFPVLRPSARPDHWVAVLLVPIFLLYLGSVSAGLQSLMGPVRKVAVTVLATSVAETLRIAIVFWVPLLAVFLWREYRRSENSWRPIHLPAPTMGVVREAVVAMLIAFGVGLIGLVLLAVTWTWVIADNPARYRELLFAGNAPALMYFPAQAAASAFCAVVTLCAADFAESTNARLRRLIPFGLMSACFVLLWMAMHTIYFGGGLYACNIGGGLFAAEGCIRAYNLTDFLVYLIVSYLAAGVFTCMPGETLKSRAFKQEAAHSATAVSKVLIGTALLGFGIAFASAAIAGEESQSCRRSDDDVIVAGFREDAEPFSYLLQYGEQKQYKGYIAQLCYKIFEGSKYTIKPVPVSAEDRFLRLRTTCADEKQSPHETIDILCDPITMEFSPERDGIYSPIVFVSGVSYILRRSQIPGKGAFLAYVRNTTAKRVVELACKIDLFDVRQNDDGLEECKIVENHCDEAKADSTNKYVICAFGDHSELIEWFCKGNSGGRQVAYFGDRELILGKLDSWTEQKDCSTANIERQQLYYTYEPYALLVTKVDPELVQFVQRRVFEIFSHRSEALSLFTTYFPRVQMSQPLANLFLLNAVSEERFFRFSSGDEIDNGLTAHRLGRSNQ